MTITSREAIAQTVFVIARERCPKDETAGAEAGWCTDDEGNTYIADDPDWMVSSDPAVATLIDAWHVLLGRTPRKLPLTESCPHRPRCDGYKPYPQIHAHHEIVSQ